MRGLWHRFKNGYLNLSLQTKFTIALISIVVLPAVVTGFLFYGKLYNMVVSNTIRQEQDASAKTAPMFLFFYVLRFFSHENPGAVKKGRSWQISTCYTWNLDSNLTHNRF